MKSNYDVKQLRAGDHGAFDRLFDQYARRVMGYLFRLTGSRTEAEDLTQETFLAAYTGRSGWRGESQPLAWLLGIAWRRWRDRQRHPGITVEPLVDDTAVLRDPTEGIPTQTVLLDALGRLAEAEREVLLLTAVEGMTYAETARILGEPLGTIKWRVHEATRKLRRILNAAEERYEAQPSETRDPAPTACTPGRR